MQYGIWYPLTSKSTGFFFPLAYENAQECFLFERAGYGRALHSLACYSVQGSVQADGNKSSIDIGYCKFQDVNRLTKTYNGICPSGEVKMKLFELRDRATFIPMFAIDWDRIITNCKEGRLITVGNLSEPSLCHFHMTTDFTTTKSRTYQCAHQYLMRHWHRLESGDMIDIEYILGETETKKKSELYSKYF